MNPFCRFPKIVEYFYCEVVERVLFLPLFPVLQLQLQLPHSHQVQR